MPKNLDWNKIAAAAIIPILLGVIALGSDFSTRIHTLEEVIRRIDNTLIEIKNDLKELRKR